MYMNTSQLRRAIPPGPDSALTMVGRLDLDGDSLVVRPMSLDLVMIGDPRSIPRGQMAAIELQKRTFQRIAASWAAGLPRSAGAKEAVAVALEMRADSTAIDTLRAAAALATDSLQRLRLSVSQVLVRLKFVDRLNRKELESIRASAESLLTAHQRPGKAAAGELAPMAVLVGRCAAAAAYANAAEPSDPLIPRADLWVSGMALMARAAMGCDANVADDAARLRRRVAEVTGKSSIRAEYVLLGRAVRLTWPSDTSALAAFAPLGDYLIRAELAVAQHDPDAVRRTLATVNASRAVTGYNDVRADGLYPEARLLLAIGDTTGAAASLDRILDRVRFSPPDMLHRVENMASFVRAMALRAEIAAIRNESGPAEWGRAFTILWSHADPALAPQVRQVSNISVRH
jgi:hypothetical protein